MTTALRLTRTDARVRPFIKWVGGKQALAAGLKDLFPLKFGTYFEPFLGGGSVYFEMSPPRAVIGDGNAWLIHTYEAVRDDWASVVGILDKMVNTKDEYNRIRAVDPASLDTVHKAAHFIYLNKTGFRGLFRVNKQGKFNVPYGEYDRRYYDRDEVRLASAALRSAEIRCGDFELTLSGIKAGDFAYFDPPYYKLGGYSDFNRYTSEQFRESDHIRLAAVCRELDQRGVLWALSNSSTDFVRTLYSGFVMKKLDARREINLKSSSRSVEELLITNY